ncbi:MAG: hypothetical protein COU27_01105 [Candidatus Levybacteria bacterium CG10_big_fil_rev_8_21_14_0_10_36_7]|nr:MAG: hypothetical protein COU27_01105 [Candidatus Levybacteria bacterium CG10_big_fil_rev_8_21_14_0_10_36_7]
MDSEIASRLVETARLLHGKDIAWCVCAGTAGSFYGVKRRITDLDILVHPKDEQKVIELLKSRGLNSRVNEQLAKYNNNSLGTLKSRIIPVSFQGTPVEFIFGVTINNKWNFAADREMYSKTRAFQVNGETIPVSSPEDVIVLKGILQRGKALGKYDIRDTLQIMKNTGLDLDYLRRRASKCYAGARVMPLITRMLKKTRADSKPKKPKRKKSRRFR